MRGTRFVPAAITPVFAGDILASIYSPGGSVKQFESELAEYFNRDNAYTFGSLMRTIYACFVALKAGSGRNKVVMPRYSCPSFIHGVLAAGLRVEYCDVDPLTLAIDIESLSRIDMDEVLAVVCTNLFGLTSEVDVICEHCRPNGVYVVEGVDYGVGTEYKGRRIGTWGDVAILNFQEGKALPVGGGAVVSSLKQMRDMYGKKRSQSFPNYHTMCGFSVFSRPAMYGVIIKTLQFLKVERKKLSMEDTIRSTQSETDFSFDIRGFDNAISDFQANLARRIMARIEMDMNQRFENAELIRQKICGVSVVKEIKPLEGVNKIHYIRFPILVGNGRRDEVMSMLLQKGIEASPMYIEHGMNVDASQYPGSARVAAELLTLPCHPYVTRDDIRILGEVFEADRR